MKANSRLTEVINTTWPVLLDFDGPMTHLFIDGRNLEVADRMRTVLRQAKLSLPLEIDTTEDPLAVLRWSASNAPEPTGSAVEAASIAGEVSAAGRTVPTPGSHEVLLACRQFGRPIVIVSNNAEEAIRSYLKRFDLEHLVLAVMARTAGHPELMKPHPDVILRALKILNAPAGECCMVGDSVTDIEVSRSTGLQSVGFAKNVSRGKELGNAGAGALISTMWELVEAIQTSEQPTTVAARDYPICGRPLPPLDSR